ncbi:hypothetical protein KC845_01530, partial [Candidatus Kaiserbacteria bacterium]|nr:hypothetical protein [Candidatus Kaiserbacteria bacterium]
MGRIVITMVFLVVLAFSLTSVFIYKTTEAAGSPVEITFHEKFCRTVGWFVRPFGFCKYGLSQLDNKDFNTENVGNESVLVQTTDPNSLDSNKVLAVGGESISNNSSSATEVPIGNIEYITNEYIVSDNTSIVENLLAQRIGEVLHYIDTLHPIATLPKSYSDSDYVTNDLLLKSLDKVYDSIQDIDSDTVVTSNYWSESAGNVYRSTGKVGIGTTLPTSALSVNGDIYVSGAFKDSSNSVGTSGMVLQTTATGTKWVATSSLGIIGGATSSVTVLNDLTNVNANSVAGSLLYFNGVEWTDIATSSLGILAGTSTNFWTQSGADIYYNIGNVGIGRTSPNAMLSIAKPATGNLAYFGDEIAFSAVGNRTQIVVGDGDNDTTFIIGQDSTHGLNFWWDYNATAASARGVLETWGGSNPLVLQSSGGNVGIGGGELSPDFKLEVIGDFGISSTANTDGDLFVVTSSGDIGIGTTSPTSLLDVWGDFKVGTSTTPLVYANPAIKRVGLGTVSPATLLHLSDVSPYIRIDDTTDTGTWFELAETSNGGLLATRALTGASLLSIDARAVDGASDATIRLFRNTNTTGVKLFQLAKGDNSSTIHAQIGVDGQDSFFQIGGGNVGIGTTTPASKLTVAGTIQTTSGIRFADGTFQTTATGGGSGGTMVTNWPDRIRCSSTSYGERVIDLANAPYVADGYYYYSKGADWVSFDSNGDYVSNSGTWGSLTSCTVDITTLYTQGRAYNTVGGGSNLWTATSSDIFFGGGNVGIGTTTPDSLLVAGDDNMRLRFNNSVDELDDPFNIGVSTVAGYSARRFTLESLVGATQVGLQFSDGLANDTIFGIGRSADTGATWNSLLSIQADGDIGFGTSTPNTDFEFYNANGADTRLRLSNDNGVNSRWEIATGDSFGDGNDFAIWGGSEGAEDYRFTINSLGNIGIGTTTPSHKLSVVGDIYVSSSGTSTFNGILNVKDSLFVESDATSGLYVTRGNAYDENLRIEVGDSNVKFYSNQDEVVGEYGGFDFYMDADADDAEF